MAAPKNMNNVFEAIKVSDRFDTSQNVVIIDSNATLLDAARLLEKKQILAAPVRDVTKPDDAPWYEKYIGIIDSNIMVLQVLETCKPGDNLEGGLPELLARKEHLATTTVGEVAGHWDISPFVPVAPEDSLLVPLLILSKHGIHRVPIVESGGDIVGIITQYAIIQMLSSVVKELGPIAKQSLADLGLANTTQVVSIPMESNTVDAFVAMRDKKVGAVALIGRDDAVIGVVSSSDIRRLVTSPSLFTFLYTPVRVFLDALKKDQVNIRRPAIMCSPSDSLESVIVRLEATHVHRVFVVDEKQKPIRIVSLTDVIGAFVEEPENFFGKFFQATNNGVGL